MLQLLLGKAFIYLYLTSLEKNGFAFKYFVWKIKLKDIIQGSNNEIWPNFIPIQNLSVNGWD